LSQYIAANILHKKSCIDIRLRDWLVTAVVCMPQICLGEHYVTSSLPIPKYILKCWNETQLFLYPNPNEAPSVNIVLSCKNLRENNMGLFPEPYLTKFLTLHIHTSVFASC